MTGLHVEILSPDRTLWQGEAACVAAPGEQGVFEIYPFHKPFVSRLLPGTLVAGGQRWVIRRGVLKVLRNTVTALVEL